MHYITQKETSGTVSDEAYAQDKTSVYHVYTMLEGDYDLDGIPNVQCTDLWYPGSMSSDQIELYVKVCKPGHVLIDYCKLGDYDEF